MKKLKILLLGMSLIFSATTFSDVAEVFTWKAEPGKDAELIQAFREAAELHQKEGAVVSIEAMNVGDTQGTYQYVLRWDDVTIVVITALILNIVATVYPALRASRTVPAEELRYE